MSTNTDGHGTITGAIQQHTAALAEIQALNESAQRVLHILTPLAIIENYVPYLPDGEISYAALRRELVKAINAVRISKSEWWRNAP